MMGIWGIVNVMFDLFSDGGWYFDVDVVVVYGFWLCVDGVVVFDVGGELIRFGVECVGIDVEQQCVILVIEQFVVVGVFVSIDMLSVEIVVVVVCVGVCIVNDVLGGLVDLDMWVVVVEFGVDFVIGYWCGFLVDMYVYVEYCWVVCEVVGEFQECMGEVVVVGIVFLCLIFDLGIGFVKVGMQNWDVLCGFDEIIVFGLCVFIGILCKWFFVEVLCGEGGQDEEVFEVW